MNEENKYFCHYCGKARQRNELIIHEIVYQQRDWVYKSGRWVNKMVVKTKKAYYCKEGCGANAQMAMEG